MGDKQQFYNGLLLLLSLWDLCLLILTVKQSSDSTWTASNYYAISCVHVSGGEYIQSCSCLCSVQKTWIRFLPSSATRIKPSLFMWTERGAWNSTFAPPQQPNDFKNFPSVLNTDTRWLLRSAMYTLSPSMATPAGSLRERYFLMAILTGLALYIIIMTRNHRTLWNQGT